MSRKSMPSGLTRWVEAGFPKGHATTNRSEAQYLHPSVLWRLPAIELPQRELDQPDKRVSAGEVDEIGPVCLQRPNEFRLERDRIAVVAHDQVMCGLARVSIVEVAARAFKDNVHNPAIALREEGEPTV